MIMNRQGYLKMFTQPEEKLLLAKVLDQADFSLKRRQITFSDFLDPKKALDIVQALCHIPDLQVLAFGGYADSERKLIGFAPDFLDFCEDDFPVAILKVSWNARFTEKLSHRDFLGSLLGLGVDRAKTGDILVYEDFAICYAEEEIASYLKENLLKVSHTKVKTELLDKKEFTPPEKTVVSVRATVASVRLDALIGVFWNLSRGKAQALVESEKVSVNWSEAKNPSMLLKEGDMISARGFGRVKLLEIQGKTRKDRIGIVFCKYV